jgi:imidazolonepropionase
LEEISDEGIHALAASKTAAVLLPTTAYILRLKPPPARKMIENNVIVALGSE